MANYFQLTKGVYVTNNAPIDGLRYIAGTITERNNIISQERAYTGLQVYVSANTADISKNGLWILETLVEWDISSSIWKKIDIDGVGGSTTLSGLTDVTLSNSVSGDTLVYSNGEWVNSAITETEIKSGVGISADTSIHGEITISNTKYVNSASLDSSNNLNITLADASVVSVNINSLVDTDSYVSGGTYSSISGGTITFEVTADGSTIDRTFDVTGIDNSSIASATDTQLTAVLSAGEHLVYDGSNWVNSAVTSFVEKNYLLNDLDSDNNVGGIKNTDTFLSGTTFEQMWENLLMAPEVLPTKSNNRSTITLNGQTSSVEIGTYLDFTLTSSYDRGIIHAYDVNKNAINIPLTGTISSRLYSGAANVDLSSGAVTRSATTTQTWTVDINYTSTAATYYTSRGIQNNDFDSYFHSGTTGSNNVTIHGYYRYFYLTNQESGGTASGSTFIRGISDATPQTLNDFNGDPQYFYKSRNIFEDASGSFTSYYLAESNKKYGLFYFREGVVSGIELKNIDSSNATINLSTQKIVQVDDASGTQKNYDMFIFDYGGSNGFNSDQRISVKITK